MTSVTEDRWYPLQETEGRLIDYRSTQFAHSSLSEDADKIDELWSKFLSSYPQTSPTTITVKPAWCCDLKACGLDGEGLLDAQNGPHLICTCDSYAGNSHANRRSHDATDTSPNGATVVSLQEACKALKHDFIQSSKKRQRDIKRRATKRSDNQLSTKTCRRASIATRSSL